MEGAWYAYVCVGGCTYLHMCVEARAFIPLFLVLFDALSQSNPELTNMLARLVRQLAVESPCLSS